MANRNNPAFLNGGDDMGMTNEQYKGLLLDQLREWKKVRDMAIKAGNVEIQKETEEYIEVIHEKLNF